MSAYRISQSLQCRGSVFSSRSLRTGMKFGALSFSTRAANRPIHQMRPLLLLSTRLTQSTRLYSTDSPTPQPPTRRENIYTLPNLVTLSRIFSCPILGWSIIEGNFELATGLLVYAGISDLFDGWYARKYNKGTVLGSILDPAADKTLMTTLVVCLAYKSLLPMPLAIVILGRDVLLSISAFYYRWISLPAPKTLTRYWDFSIPSAEVRPTQISKYNTFLQLLLMGSTILTPLIPSYLPLLTAYVNPFMTGLQWIVGGTTVWSGLSYVFSKDAVRILTKEGAKNPPK